MTAFSSTLLLLVAQQLMPASCIPSFPINLDLPPKDRWTDVVKYYREPVLAMTKALTPIINKQLKKDKEEWLKIDFGTEYEEELGGMIDAMNDSSVSKDMLKLTNMLYELESPLSCSGVLLAKPDGTVVHGRNMDYGFHFKMPDGGAMNWPNITFDAIFEKAGKKLFQSTMWPGGVGLSTAMRFDGWSVEQQTRMPNKWQTNLAAAKAGARPFSIELRNVMTNTPNFQDALDKIYATKFMAPMYFVMAGSKPFEGAVVTIDRLGQHLPDTPPVQKISKSNWRLVQTNDDQLHTPKDPRRPLANMMLESEVQQTDVSETQMMQFMHNPPLYDPMTVYSTVMVPATGYYKTVLPDELPGQTQTLESIGGTAVASAIKAGLKLAASDDVKNALVNEAVKLVAVQAGSAKAVKLVVNDDRKAGLLSVKEAAEPQKRAPRRRGFLAEHSPDEASTLSLLQNDFHLEPTSPNGREL